MILPKDMPKLESPFIRVNDAKGYIVTPQIAEGYEWVFTDPDVRAIEKLHGTNVSIIIENCTIVSVWNRTERIPFINKGKRHISEAILEAYERGYCELPDGQWFGECIGPKVNGNPYHLDKHIWVPFTHAWDHLAYTSWGKHPKTFESINEWFKTLMPLYSTKVHGKDYDKHYVEGVVFTSPDGRMAKLRVDMFDWFSGKRHGD